MNAGGNLQRPNFGSQQNLSTSFIAGSSGIGDDELADLINYPDASESSGQQGDMGMHSGNVAQPQYGSIQGHSAIAMNQANQYVNNMYSQTPDGPGPIQSPFAHSFNYAQYMMQSQAQSPMQRPSHGMHQSFDMSTRLNSLRNTGSISKSHMTPKTAVSTGQGESPNSIAQAVQGSIGRGHQKTPSGQFVGGSAQSYTSPLSSPHAAQQSISMSSSRKESVASSAPASSLEAKRQKRRQSHNAVERRRRDNINDRISDLSHLVPGHRLEDDKIKKHVSSNNPFPPNLSGVSSMSPPQASSLLAGGTGRRAIGSISSAVPIDDKDKGPAKGDVLNGAVGWMRDLMWILHRKIQQESILLETIESLGGSNPLQIREDELRMQSELLDAIQRNGVSTFEYSRANGSGLWVPNVRMIVTMENPISRLTYYSIPITLVHHLVRHLLQVASIPTINNSISSSDRLVKIHSTGITLIMTILISRRRMNLVWRSIKLTFDDSPYILVWIFAFTNIPWL